MYKFLKLSKAKDNKHKYIASFLNLDTNKQINVPFGAYGMSDYTIYNKTKGKEEADKHKERYIKRHQKNEDWNNPISAGALSRFILWNKLTVKDSLEDYLNKFKKSIE